MPVEILDSNSSADEDPESSRTWHCVIGHVFTDVHKNIKAVHVGSMFL